MSFNFKKFNNKTIDKNEFHFIYASALLALTNVSGPAIKVYCYLLLNYKIGETFGINQKVKELIMKFIKTNSVGTISNALTELCKNDLLFRVGNTRGAYIINPKHAWQGAKKEREQTIINLSHNK